MKIAFRPHHFLCTLCFQGEGYSEQFIANFKQIVAILREENSDNTAIKITTHTDSICAPCPHKKEKNCEMQEKIKLLDHAHSSALNIKTTSMITWGEAKTRIKENLTLDTFHKICATCSWKTSGICERVLRDFLSK